MLTTRTIEALAPRPTRYAVPDQKVPGLELRVTPFGVKTWSLRYRTAAGVQRRLKLGRYPHVSLGQARHLAQRALRDVDTGGDPQAARVAARAAVAKPTHEPEVITVATLAKEYLERHARPRKRSWREDDRILRHEILPHWGDRPVTSITRRDGRLLVQAVADRGAPISANRIAALLSRVFRFAVDDELIASNPMVRLPRFGVEAHLRGDSAQKAYDDEEIRAIWRASATLEPRAQAIIRLGLLTGQRPGEIQHAQWAEFAGSWWTIPAARAKNGREHRVPLTEPARALLARVPRIIGEPHVFAGCRHARDAQAINKIVFAGLRRRDKPRHALRDTVATGLAACGVPVETIARVLNHATGPRVTAGYNAYRYDREKAEALERWADHLLTLVGEAKAAAEAAAAS